ncbi:phospholipase A [Flavobacterium sp. W21_SRS_FM6]|uniref:phospholipase A n=1 Tax=Flavobacterium sp. W21_SRS_FM6 TaxID=3240268 RepID=UPI003F8DCE97
MFTLFISINQNKALLLSALVAMLMSSGSVAQDIDDACILKIVKEASDTLTVAEIRRQCIKATIAEVEIADTTSVEPLIMTGALHDRIMGEKKTELNPYVITPHRMTYILPALTTNSINKHAYRSLEGFEENLEDIEAKFQISLKAPLNRNDLFIEGDGVYLGFTLQAWWQIYAQGISRPFRETNYQPEIFYAAPLGFHPLGGNTGVMVGIEHQSNGRGQGLSRSWNRIYSNFLFEKENFALSFRPWIRLSESQKQYELDPDGDDNPDIEDYMGHFELGMAYKWDTIEVSFLGRRNVDTNKGFIEIGFTFPLLGKLKGYVTASDGYGESLIDYNYRQTRFGLGIALNNIL